MHADEFHGTTRFEVRRRIGAGASSVVYEGYDRERETRVAIKVLRQVEPASLVRFKREFRSLADVTHPNLVALHELAGIDGLWFVTMELVEGVDLLEWVRPGHAKHPTETCEYDDASHGRVATLPTELDMPRLREALRQLCVGVAALHSIGKLHRDIKPSNVIVTKDGRVVLLDFGLVVDARNDRGSEPAELVVGTAAYMAPEQSVGTASVTTASDWYSVGAILYEALTGWVPFVGPPLQVLAEKQQREPIPPRELARDAPPDLASLCESLLRRDQEARPSMHEILRAVGVERESATSVIMPPPPDAGTLIGRDEERAMLDDALAIARRGTPVSVVVLGGSGIGKSALVHTFLASLDPSVVVLAGRCYERESVPYKAFDNIVDSLARYMMLLPPAELAPLLPPDVAALARVFPVLRRVTAIGSLPTLSQRAMTAELRQHAFRTLQEVLRRIAERKTLVAFIDDAQWGDKDSGALLTELLTGPVLPALLLVSCHRSGDVTSESLLTTLRTERAGVHVREIALEPLADGAARALSRHLVGNDTYHDRIALEANGSPFLLVQLAHHVRHGVGFATSEVRFEEVLDARRARLSSEACRMLELIAIAGHPIALDVAREAADVREVNATLAPLRASQLVRTGIVHGRETIECYHDRIRETVSASLAPADARMHHARLARALEARPGEDPEAIFAHFEAAGESAPSATFARIAAERAAEALAWGRAADLFARALALDTHDTTTIARLRARRAEVLALDGRGALAADEFCAAAALCGGIERLDLERCAAEQLLRCGHIDRGIAMMRSLLDATGVSLASSPVGALPRLLAGRARLATRGLDFVPRDASEIAPRDLLALDVAWSLGAGLSLVDPLRAAEVQTWFAVRALDVGEPTRVARALMGEVLVAGMRGRRAVSRSDALLAKLEAIAARSPDGFSAAGVMGARGICAVQLGRWREGKALSERAFELVAQGGASFETTIAEHFLVFAMYYLGNLRELRAWVPARARDAEARGDQNTATDLRTHYPNLAWILAGDVEEARRQARGALAYWSRAGFHAQHYYGIVALANADLYEGEGERAFREVKAGWPGLRRSMMLFAEGLRIDAVSLRARAALAAGTRKEHLASAARDARYLRFEDAEWAVPLADLVEAALASSKRDEQRAARLLRDAISRFDAADMRLHAACARTRLARLLGGAEGRALRLAADAYFTDEEVTNPEGMLRMIAPGFRD